MTNKIPRRFAVFFFTLALIELVFLSTLVPLDAAVCDWIGTLRSCQLDYLLSWVNRWLLTLLFFAAGLILVGLIIRGRWTEAWHAAGVVLLGGFLSELLKTGFERARPSVLPPLTGGNSFPSGHAIGAILVAGILGFFLLRQKISLRVKISGIVILVSLVGAVIWQRLYFTHHWFSDVLGSVLLASAWLCLALPSVGVFRPSRRFAMSWGGLLVCYQVFYFFPAVRIVLPSVATVSREPLLSLSFGDEDFLPLLRGAWGGRSCEAARPITWMHHGEASVEVPLADRQRYRVKLAMRPFLQTKAFACFPLEILLNHQLVERLILSRGWREYELQLDPALIIPGVNLLTFRTGAGFPSTNSIHGVVAFHRLLLFADDTQQKNNTLVSVVTNSLLIPLLSPASATTADAVSLSRRTVPSISASCPAADLGG